MDNAIRADYDRSTVVVWQAYGKTIAERAIKEQGFVSPFSMQRMSWIKPSYLWLMHRSNWGQKPHQDHILQIRIKRSGWESALSQGVLTSFAACIHGDHCNWARQFKQAKVHIQWDPERTIRGKDAGNNSIQVGLSRHILPEFVHDWIVSISDFTRQTRKIHRLLMNGQGRQAKAQLPPEKIYTVSDSVRSSLGMGPA